MKAVSLLAPQRIEVVDAPEPGMGAEDVLIQVGYVGLCGSDLNAYRGLSPLVTYPRVLGHEIGGTIIARGGNAPADLAVGTRVTVSPYSHCGTCPACRVGRINTCVSNQTLGVQRDGALAERIAIHASKVYASANLSLQELALVEPLSVGYHATTRGGVAAPDTVLVLGCGAVGLGAVAGAARRGGTVIATDVDETKLALASRLGAAHVLNSARDNVGERVGALTSGEGVSVVIEAVGLPQTYQMALELVATAGRVVCIGYTKQSVELDTRLIVRKELAVMGSRNALSEFGLVIGMLEQRANPFPDMITRVVPLEETAQALADWSASPQSFTRILVQVG